MIQMNEFLNVMVDFFPNIKKDIDEYMEDYYEGIDTIIIEDIVMPEIIKLLEKDMDENKARAVFDYFEEVCINADKYLMNVFSITALEILGNEKTILETAKKYMGPATTKLQREADIAIGRQV